MKYTLKQSEWIIWTSKDEALIKYKWRQERDNCSCIIYVSFWTDLHTFSETLFWFVKVKELNPTESWSGRSEQRRKAPNKSHQKRRGSGNKGGFGLFHFSPDQFKKHTHRLRMVSEILELQYVDLLLLETAVSGFIAWVRRWHTPPPSQTRDGGGPGLGPPRWPSPRCCCAAPASGGAGRGGAPACGRSLRWRNWCAKRPGAAAWGPRWSGHSAPLRASGGGLPPRRGSSGRRCEGASSRPRCGGWSPRRLRAKQKRRPRVRRTPRGAAGCNRLRHSSPLVMDCQPTVCW